MIGEKMREKEEEVESESSLEGIRKGFGATKSGAQELSFGGEGTIFLKYI